MGSRRVRAIHERAPDLLFEDQQAARVEEIAPLLAAPERIDASVPLHRLTVFVTYGCNLACPYCKTIARDEAERQAAPHKRLRHDLASFTALLAAHAGTPLRHLHLTGGEAATVAEVVEMVRVARAQGVRAISMTSNGTLPAQRYLDLVAAGLDELRISIDADHAALGARLTLRSGAFEAATRTLTELAAARRAGTRFVLILNAVVGLANRRRLPALVRFLLRFRPDDVKLITEVDRRDDLGDFPEAAAVRKELEAILATEPPDGLPLLRRKLATVFAHDAIGLEHVPEARPWRCYIPLTERTVDRVAYYPCSVYLREGGAPLGPLTDPPEAQRARSAAFVRDGDCLRDPICRRYCLHCTRTFNDRANEARP